MPRPGRATPAGASAAANGATIASIEASTARGWVFDTDVLTSNDDLDRFGKHVPFDHGEVHVAGPARIDGIEGFSSYAKGLHRACRGADRENFPVSLAADEFRYNHRDEHHLERLFKWLDRPEPSRAACPRKFLSTVV
jgi:hypothetical protein